MTQEEKITVRKLFDAYGFQVDDISCELLTDLCDAIWSDYLAVSNCNYRALLFVDYNWVRCLCHREGFTVCDCSIPLNEVQ